MLPGSPAHRSLPSENYPLGRNWVVGAQLSTHAAGGRSNVAQALAAVARVASAVKLDLLILGASEVPELFAAFTDRQSRPVPETYLWYNLLSDVPGFDTDDLVVNWRGEVSRGWGGWAEQQPDVHETFRFACPNNPEARRKTLSHLGKLLDRYPFDGVFLDKMRFPSAANGANDMVSCFCPHCRRAAAATGLDLTAVARLFEARSLSGETQRGAHVAAGKLWTDELLAETSLLRSFLRFRSDSITRLVAEASAEARVRGRRVALDLFSPSLAPIVGQDYHRLAEYADWVKPMTYRVARGPASLRLELPAVVANLAKLSGSTEAEIVAWCTSHIAGFDPKPFDLIDRVGVPFEIVRDEIAMAVRTMKTVPVYFGLELIRYEGSFETTPDDVIGAVRAGQAADAAGAIISWDLMHAPADGLAALDGAL